MKNEKEVNRSGVQDRPSEPAIVLAENSRVRRKKGSPCQGTVQSVRQEIRPSQSELEERGLLVTVLWDNGTCSCVTPEALDVV